MIQVKNAVMPALFVSVVAMTSGCSAIAWGSDGAEVVAASEQLIADMSSGNPPEIDTCAGVNLDFGDARQWEGLGAGEPDKADAGSPGETWTINLENSVGSEQPSDLQFERTKGKLCISSIQWRK